MITLTVKEILNELVDYYSTNPRGITSEEGCTYKGCAIGYICGWPDQSEKWDDKGWFVDVTRRYNWKDFENRFIDSDYHGHSKEFWIDVQAFHDNPHNWEPNSLGGSNLSKRGKKAVNLLISLYS